jgi:Superfamily I DNA and RNA helicases and helicase subunits
LDAHDKLMVIFYHVQGPPGTGKSTTIVQMVKAANEPCIVAAPSNAATASIAMKIFQSSNYSIAGLCVFGGNSDPSVDFLNPTIRREKFHVFSKKYGKLKTREKRIKALRDFCLWLHLGKEEENFRYIPHGEDLDNDDDLELTNRVIRKLHDEDLNDDENFLELTNRLFRILSLLCNQLDELAVQNSQIIFCTLNSSGSMWLRNNSGGRRTFFLDEAGQCNEAEFYLATTFPSVERVVVVGDPMQLPPTVISKTCEAAGFGRSWMANVYDEKSGSIHLLDTQYRM